MPPRASEFSFARYLTAKRTVDDRALNKDVLERLKAALPRDSAVRIVELGAGLGAMVPRLVDWGIVRRATYVLLEMDPSLLGEARRTLAAWAAARGYSSEERADALLITGDGGLVLTLEFRCAELEAYLAEHADFGDVDLLVASAFLDLVDLARVTPRLVSGPRAPRLFWFSINFDGETIFEPAHEHDRALLAVYHRSMDERVRDGRPAGDSRSGRHLFSHLRAAGATVLAAGASDWLVWPAAGRYPADEQYFLEHLIDTIERELVQHADVDQGALGAWVALRRGQIERGELVFIAHQLDFLGRP
jgi:hypothetical protein